MGCRASASQANVASPQTTPFHKKPEETALEEIFEEEDDVDESDSETSLASEGEDEGQLEDTEEDRQRLEHDELTTDWREEEANGPAAESLVYSLAARKLLVGDISDDMPENVRVVRIFTSSTFTDTSVERNTLMEQVYPKLKSFCQERGFDFQVVDMRWGIREEAADDHTMTDLCMRELTACQRLSTGPNFVTFMGQKYGYRPLQPRIAATEFECLLEAVEIQEDAELLKHWYWRDANNVPPVYMLQSISSHLPHYNEVRDSTLRGEARQKWWAAYERLHVILRRAADKVLSKEERRKYYMSVTEEEIRRGIINSPSPAKQCFWFRRNITDLRKNANKPKAAKFIDKTQDSSDVDERAQELLNSLQQEEIPEVLPSNNVIQYDISWSDNGVDPAAAKQHKEYIENLCNRFQEILSEMIQEGIKEKDTLQIDDPLTKEVLDHASFCLRKCRSFHGREEFLQSVRDSVLTNGERVVVIHGESGCGKTSILAKIIKEVKLWLDGKSCITVFRFLGTSPDSSNARQLLRSVCQQLCTLTGQNTTHIPDDMKSLSEFFPKCLEKAASEMHVVLVLDSLDQLSPEDGGRQMNWWPRSLPDRVFVVMSTLPGDEFEAHSNLKIMFAERCFKEVPQMAVSEADVILSSWLKSANRTLQPSQKEVILSTFQHCQLPLYLKLAFDEAMRWKSYTPVSETRVEPTVKDIISALFDRLESLHGQLLVSHALGYITASKSGLTEPELEDLLSMDDTVLNDVYQFWTPPIRRMLPALWFRIHADIGDYLIQRGANGVPVVYWYHRQFIEVARDRYLKGKQGDAIHFNMSEYFLGTWAGGNKKPFVNKESERVYTDRLVAKQPLMFDSSEGKAFFNFRKLTELPHHLLKSHQLEKLKEEALCSFEFLLAKLRASSLDVVLEDFSAALDVYGEDADIGLLEKFMRLSATEIMKDPRQLASQVIGRLQSFANNNTHPNVSKIVKDAYNSTVPCFIPSFECLTSPGGALVSSTEVGDQNAVCEFSCDGKTVFVGFPTKDGVEIKVLDIRTGKSIRRVNFRWEDEKAFRWFLRSSEHHKDRLLLAGSRTVFLVDVQTKRVLKIFDALSDSLYNFHYPVAFACNEEVVAAMTDTALKIWNTSDGAVVHSFPLGHLDHETTRTMDARGNYVVYSLHGEGFHVLDVSSGREIALVEVAEKVKEIKISALNQIVVLLVSRKGLLMYDLESRCFVKNIPEYEAYFGLQRLQLTQGGSKAVSYNDSFVMLTDLKSGDVQKLPKSSLLGNRVDCANLFSSDGRYIHAVCFDKIVRTYKYQAAKKKTSKEEDSLVKEKTSGVYPGVDGRHVVTTSMGSEGQILSVWDVPSASVVRRLRCSNVGVNEVRMLNSTQAVAKIYIEERKEFSFGLMDLKEGTILKWLDGNAGHSWAMGFMNPTHFLAFSRVQRQLEIWDISTGRLVQQRGFGSKFRLADALLSVDGEVVVCSLVRRANKPKKSLPLIVLATKTDEHHLLKIHNKQLTLRAASLDKEGRYLFCTTVDHMGLICDVRRASLMHTLKLPGVTASGFSTTLQLAVTSHRDGTLLVIGISTGQILHRYRNEPADKILISSCRPVAYTFHRNAFYAWDLEEDGNIASFTADWEPTSRHVHVIGDHVVMCLPDRAREMTLRLHVPGWNEEEHMEQSPYDGRTLEGNLQC